MDGNLFDRMTRWLAGTASRRTALGAAAAGMAMARASDVRALRATSESTPESTQKPVFMFVQTALMGRAEANPHAGTPTVEGSPVAGGGASYLLTLEGHSGQTIYFSDRPERMAGQTSTDEFLEALGFTPFDPPNAALVAEFAAGDGVMVLELVSPTFDAETGTLTYGVEMLEGFAGENLAAVTEDQVAARLPAEFAHASLFIDDCADLTTCYRDEHVEIGPIPNGPTGRCWSWWPLGCQPCWYSWDELGEICDGAYANCYGRCFAGGRNGF